MAPRGGLRPNQTGRPRRSESKALSIWCGQISAEQRQLIIDTLTPEERLAALLAAVQAKTAVGGECVQDQ